MDSLIPLLIITGLILLNGLFVAAEFAIVGAPRAAIERRAAQGHRVARRVRRTLRDPRRQDRYIATAQLGITFASLGLGMYGEHVLAQWLAGWFEDWGASRWIAAHALASVVSITVLTYFHIVVGEMVPKSLALQQAEATVLWVTPLMEWIKLALYPLVVGLNGIGNGLLRLMGIDRQTAGGEHYHTPEELRFIVQESQEGGLLRPGAGQVLRELFEFGELTAGEVMVPRVRITGIRLETAPDELAALLRTAPHTRYPVCDGDLDHIVGVVHIKDLLRRLLEGEPLAAEDARPVPYLPQTAGLDTVLAAMRRERAQMVIVLDEHGGTAGLVTIEDLCEEVVGPIDEGASSGDPRDNGDREIYQDASGRLHVAGTARVAEVGESLGRPLEHEEIDTVSGLILTLLERPSRVGDVVTYEGIRFEVTAVAGHGVEECVVSLPA
jgi:CBS domain containing-hemolysin-like protein